MIVLWLVLALLASLVGGARSVMTSSAYQTGRQMGRTFAVASLGYFVAFAYIVLAGYLGSRHVPRI